MEGSRGGGGNCWPVKPVCYLPQASTDRPASNYPGLTLAHPGLKLFTGLPAVTIAAQLAPYHRGGRHGHEFADPLIETAIANHINHTSPAIRPHAALKAVLSQVEPIVDVVQVASRQPWRAGVPTVSHIASRRGPMKATAASTAIPGSCS